MKHSFVTPRPKRLISGEMKLVLFFFSMTLIMVAGAYFFLAYKISDFASEKSSFAQKEKLLNRSMKSMEHELGIIEAEISIAEDITTGNTVLKERIHDLFDLVPESITLSQAELDEKSLILYGITPNKETYNYMLYAPLHSIFAQTYTSFYPADNGWYRFVSTNYLEEAEEIQ